VGLEGPRFYQSPQVFRGREGPRFHRNRKDRICRAYGARDSTALFPRPAGRGYLLPRLRRWGFDSPASASGKQIEANAKVPDFRAFHYGIVAGEVSLATDEAKLQYAWVHMNQLLQNMRAKRFEDALRVVSERRRE
jgi:hypothetical protein